MLSSTQSQIKKTKIHIKKSNGLMPRGNTLDHRYTGPAIYGGSAQ